jgi:hypothetical protein
MNDMSPETGTALALPANTELAVLFRQENGLDPILSRIVEEVRSHVADTSTAKGRDAIKSLAYKVSRSKTALDDAGKRLNEDARAQINIVDAARKRIRDQLDALRDEARKPLDDWEDAEELRLNLLKARLRALDAGRADATFPAQIIAEVLAEVEATEIGEDWQEYQGEAAIAKDRALTDLRRNLEIARKREADAAELERLRAEQVKRDEEARAKREAEEAAARLAERAKNARRHIEEAAAGRIGGTVQPYGVLIYELEQKIPDLIDQLGEHAAELHALRRATLANLTEALEEQRLQEEDRADEARKAAADQAVKDAEARAARERDEAEARHQRELEDARRREEEAAQREQERLADERRAEAEAQRRREENTRIRNRVRREIIAAIANMPPDQIADALIEGRVPNCTVRF